MPLDGRSYARKSRLPRTLSKLKRNQKPKRIQEELLNIINKETEEYPTLKEFTNDNRPKK